MDSLFYWCFPSLCKQIYSICLFLFPLPGEIYTKTLLRLLSKKNHLWFLAAYWITSWHFLEFSICLITIFHDIKIGFWKIIILYFQIFLEYRWLTELLDPPVQQNVSVTYIYIYMYTHTHTHTHNMSCERSFGQNRPCVCVCVCVALCPPPWKLRLESTVDRNLPKRDMLSL